MRLRNVWVYGLGLTLATSRCRVRRRRSGDVEHVGGAGGASAAARRPKVDPATAGERQGHGRRSTAPRPKNEPIRMNADPVCVKRGQGRAVAGNLRRRQRRQVARQRVRLREGRSRQLRVRHADRAGDDRSEGLPLHPHVFGIRVGQPLEIVNSDPTLHNIHAMPKANPEFNNGQPIQGMKMTHTFTAKEVMVPFKCDVHGWMNAYVGVLDHPVLRGDRRGRQVRASSRCRRHLHDRSVAREARRDDPERDDRREGNEGRHVHVQGAGGGDD